MKHFSQYFTERLAIQAPILESGASGHMLHPQDVDDFTGSDIQELISKVFGGELEGMTEKMDGFGIQASMNTKGEVVFIRNKGNLNSEKGGMTTDDFPRQWDSNPIALENYTKGARVIEAVFKKIGPDWFNPELTKRRVVNCECILEGVTNTVPYATDQVDFHNIWIYELDPDKGIEWVNTEVTKKGLDVIEKACEGIDNAQLTPQVIIKYSQETEKLKEKWMAAWQKFLKDCDCSEDMTIEAIKYSLFFKWAEKDAPWLIADRKAASDCFKRWLFGDKHSANLKDLKAIYQDNINEFNKLEKSPSKVANAVCFPLQKFFYGMGADVVKVTSGLVNDGRDDVVKSLIKDLQIATEKIKKEGSAEDNEFLQTWLSVLDEIGQENISSAEGIVFSYKGKMMKFTGGFVPLNRIIGYSKYTMKPKSLAESLFDKELAEKDLVLHHPKTKADLIVCIRKELSEQGPDADLNVIDVSAITNMDGLFHMFKKDIRNINISKWDVSGVTDMDDMFFKCTNFNCDLSKWDVSNVESCHYMFYGCKKFNSDLSGWKLNKIHVDMDFMFDGCASLKKIPSWYAKS